MFNNGFNVCFTTLALQLRHGGGGLTLKVCVLAVGEDFFFFFTNCATGELLIHGEHILVLYPLMSSFVSNGPFEIILRGSLTLAPCMFPYVRTCSSYVVCMLNLLRSVCNGPFGKKRGRTFFLLLLGKMGRPTGIAGIFEYRWLSLVGQLVCLAVNGVSAFIFRICLSLWVKGASQLCGGAVVRLLNLVRLFI